MSTDLISFQPSNLEVKSNCGISPPLQHSSGSSTPSRSRPTTLDIPGLTRSKVSPDGRIAQRDIGSKLVIVMVGLPARGKSYVTRKIARYLNWLQHDTRIFNVGERRRVAAGGPGRIVHPESQPVGRRNDLIARTSISTGSLNGIVRQKELLDPPTIAAKILINDKSPTEDENTPLSVVDSHDQRANGEPIGTRAMVIGDGIDVEPAPVDLARVSTSEELPGVEAMEQSASFFDPQNVKAAQMREQVAMSTLDELLDYVLDQGGSVGILDATNSTLERRKLIMKKVRQRAGPELGVLFLESLCVDPNVGKTWVPSRDFPKLRSCSFSSPTCDLSSQDLITGTKIQSRH